MAATAGSEPAGHSHEMEDFSAGESGDPKDLSRIIQVSMEERDGKMLYVPAQVEIRKGETIKFVIFNNGELDHEFVLERYPIRLYRIHRPQNSLCIRRV